MSLASLDETARDGLRAELESVPGVRRALFEAFPPRVYVICDPTDSAPTEPIVRAVLARNGLGADEVEVQLCHVPIAQPRRRVRFISARVEPARGGMSALVMLEWAGSTYQDRVHGEAGPAMELRLAALATIRTLEAVLHGAATFQLVGIKTVRAFDTDLVVAMLRPGEQPATTLVGLALASDSPHRSAALAVLNATNRHLGNFLHNLDTNG